MHHYTPSIMVIWLFVLLAVLLVGILLFLAPRLMKYLDEWTDRRKETSFDEKLSENRQQEKSE